MFRINTRRNIAFVKDMSALCYRAFVQQPGKTMRGHVFAVDLNFTITNSAPKLSGPQPATVFLFADVFHEPRYKRLRVGNATAANRTKLLRVSFLELGLTYRAHLRRAPTMLIPTFAGAESYMRMLRGNVEGLLAMKAKAAYCLFSHVGNQSFLTVVRAA
jgi:hypothetical protein